MSVNLGTAYVDIQGNFDSLSTGLDNFFGGSSGKFKKAAAGVAGVTVAAAAAGKALYDIGGQFDDAYDTIRVSTGKTGQALEGLKTDFKQVVKDVPADFGSASKAVSEINQRLGLTGKPLQDLSKQFLELSRITGTDLSSNIESATRAFGDWGVKTKDQPKRLDQLFRAFQQTGTPVAKLSDLLVKYGAPLRQLGFGFEQSTALIGKFEQAGVNTQLVMGSMRVALGKMARAGESPVETFKRVTDQIKNAGDAGKANGLALELFGARAGPDMAAAIREGKFEIDDLVKSIGGGGDTIMKASKDTQDFSEKWKTLKNRVLVGLEPIATKVFDAIGQGMDLIGPAAEKVQAGITAVKNAFGGAEGSSSRFKSIIESVKGVLTGLGTIASQFWDTFGGPITDNLKEWADNMAQIIEGAMKTLSGIVDFIAGVFTGDWRRAWDGIKQIFTGVWQALSGVVDIAWEAVKLAVKAGVLALVGIVKGLATPILDLGKWLVGKIVDGIKAAGSAISDAASWFKNRVVEFVKNRIDDFKSVGSWVLNRIVDGIKTIGDALSGIGGWIKNRVSDFIHAEIEGFKTIGGWVLNRLVDGIKTIGSGLESIGGWIKNRVVDAVRAAKDGFLSIGGTMLDWIVDGLKSGGNALVGFVNRIIRVINKIPGVDIGEIKGFAMGGTTDDLPAFATGGVAHHDALKRGSSLTRPMMVVGEEAPRHPEFIIPTNPAYRQRALGLFSQLGASLGIPGFKRGGVSGSVDAGSGVSGKAKTGTKRDWVPDLPGLGDLVGKLPGVGDLPDWLKGTGKWLVSKAKSYISGKIKSLFSSGGGRTDRGWTGLKPQVKAAVNFARAHGWVGQISEGFRTYAQQAVYYQKWLNGTGNLAARPGTSNHEQGEAVDVTAPEQFAWAMSQLGAGDRLYRRVPGEPWHFSITGHRRGGVFGGAPFVGSYKNGGVIPRDGLAYVHQGETVTPADAGGINVEVLISEQVVGDIAEVRVMDRERRVLQTFNAGGIR